MKSTIVDYCHQYAKLYCTERFYEQQIVSIFLVSEILDKEVDYCHQYAKLIIYYTDRYTVRRTTKI